MPVLTDTRYERYCQFIVAGMNKRNSAIQAGFKPSGAGCQAVILGKLPEIQMRIKELQERVARKMQKKIMSAVERQVRLSEFATSNLADFLNENGEPEIVKGMKGEGAIAEYTVKHGKFGTSKSIKLRDPIASIDLLNKMDRIYLEQPAGNTTNNTWNILVVDNEAKDLITQVKARTQKSIEG